MEPSQEPEPKKLKTKTEPGALQYFLYALGCFAAAVVLFLWLQNLEVTGGAASAHWLIAMLYSIGGKWTVSIIVSLVGVLFLIAGVASLGKKK